IDSGASGTGNGAVGYTVSANSEGQRSGYINIGGEEFYIIQAGICDYDINPRIKQFTSSGGNGAVLVAATSDACSWDAQTAENGFVFSGVGIIGCAA
ncbi:hypothetical protein MCHI_000586, partial [Candidatus Magnetoovum chiemensis]